MYKKERLMDSPSALRAWECYEYQGHITLYIALKKINELLENNEDVSQYEVQIEGEEDFSIRKDGEYISLHQVKAGKINLSQREKFAFAMGIIQSGAQYGVFHISKKESVTRNFLSETLKYIDILNKDLNKEVISSSDRPADRGEEEYIIIEKISGNHKRAEAYDLIKYRAGRSKEKSDIEAVIKNIKELLDQYKTIIKKKMEGHTGTTEQDEIYIHICPEKFDNNKEIREEAYEIIGNILKRKHPEYSFVDDDYKAFVYDILFSYMKKSITDSCKNGEKKCTLLFGDILKTVVDNYCDKMNTALYQYFLVLRSIQNEFSTYPSMHCGENICESCEENTSCNLHFQIKELDSKVDDVKNRIIHNLILHTPKPGKSNNLPSDDMVYNLFIDLLKEVGAIQLKENNNYEAIKEDGQTYRLMLKEICNIHRFASWLNDEVKEEEDKELLYECDVLIAGTTDSKEMIFGAENTNLLTAEGIEEISEISGYTVEKMKKNFYKPKVIRIIGKEQAKEELET